jgi:hypothetical protein
VAYVYLNIIQVLKQLLVGNINIRSPDPVGGDRG